MEARIDSRRVAEIADFLRFKGLPTSAAALLALDAERVRLEGTVRQAIDEAAALQTQNENLRAEVALLKRSLAMLDQALNEGDGTYRP